MGNRRYLSSDAVEASRDLNVGVKVCPEVDCQANGEIEKATRAVHRQAKTRGLRVYPHEPSKAQIKFCIWGDVQVSSIREKRFPGLSCTYAK